MTVISRASSASGLLKRNISAATGVSANTPTAISPATGPKRRRTAVFSTAAVASAIRTWGARIAQEFSPNSRTDRAIGQSAAGGLSTVMALAESSEPKKSAFQLWLPAWTAAE